MFARFYGSSNFLSYPNAPTTGLKDSIESQFTALQFKLGLFHEFLPDPVAQEENLSLMLGIAYTYRSVLGDIIQNDAEKLRRIINTDGKHGFHGMDLVFTAKMKDFRVEFILPFVFSNNKEVPGLTNTQFITSFRFLGGFDVGLKQEKKLHDF